MTDAKPATHWRPQHGHLCMINNLWAEKKACDCGLAETLMITLGHDELRIDTERAARLAAEAQLWKPGDPRCDACDNGIANAWTYCAWCGTALKEPANG